jgi:SulP family sulfate permease
MPNGDRAVLLLTFGLTVLVDLTVAIGVGVTLASLLFMARMSATVEVSANGHGLNEEDEDEHQREAIPEGVEVFRISGPFFFGAVSGLLDTFRAMGQPPRILIVRMRLVPMIDATGATAVEEFINQAARTGTKVIFSGVKPQPLEMLRRVHLGPQDERIQFASNYPEALRLAADTNVSA